MIKVSVSFPVDLKAQLMRIVPTDTDMRILGGEAVDTIKKRTQEGRDVSGKLFTQYSTPYMIYKSKANKYVGYVNLSFDGDMQGSMQVRPIRNGAQIYFANAERGAIAQYHHEGMGNNPTREFFGLSEAELARLTDKLSELLRGRA